MLDEEEILNMYGEGAFDEKFNLKHHRKIYIDKYIEAKTIKPLLQYGELNLLVAPTGAGKTYSIMEVMKQLSKENTTTSYIIACPNRIQNIQNKKYGVSVWVGGVEKEYNLRTVSMVYDLAEQTIKQCESEGRKVVLIVDEAHQLIDAYDYRKKAIKGLLDLIKNHTVKRTLLITATPQKINERLGIFNYNYSYYIRYNDENKVKNVNTLKVIVCKNKENALIDIINKNKKQGIVSVVELNNIEEHGFFELLLTKRGFKVESLHSKNKNYIYDSIIQKDIIPAGVDVLLTTSMLQCGTNIKNTNVSFIAIPNKPSYLDLDCLEQFYARPRLYNDVFYLILEDLKTKNKFKELEEIVNDFGKEVTGRVKELNKAIEGQNDDFKKELVNIITKTIESDEKSITRNCIIFDEEYQLFTVDEYLFTKQIFRMYYLQFYFYTDKLKEELRKRIKCNEVIIENINTEISDEIKQDIKDIKISGLKTKEEQKQEAKQVFNEVLKNVNIDIGTEENKEIKKLKDTGQEFLEDLEEYINDNKYLKFARQKEKLETVILDKKSVELMKKMLDIGQDIKTSVLIVANRETDQEVKDKICEIGYMKLNQLYGKFNSGNKNDKPKINIPKAHQIEYFKIRNNLDEVMKKRDRLTEKRKVLLAKELNLLKPRDIKLWNEKKELSEATGRKLMKVINFVYVVTKDNKVTSLKK